MGFSDFKITTKGRNLLGKGQSGQAINFTRFQIGKGGLQGVTSIEGMTALVDPIKYLPIASIESVNGNATIKGQMSNKGMDQFDWKELGLFAKDPVEGEILYAYANAAISEPIPAGSGNLMEFTFAMVIKTGDATNVTVNIDDGLVFATKADVVELQHITGQKLDISAVAYDLNPEPGKVLPLDENGKYPNEVFNNYVSISNLDVPENFSTAVAQVGTLGVSNADVAHLVASSAQVEILEATNTFDALGAQIGNLNADIANVGSFGASVCGITELNATNAAVGNLNADVGNVGNFGASNAQVASLNVSGTFDTANAQVGNLNADVANIGNFNASGAHVADLNADVANTGNLNADVANVGNLGASSAQVASLNVTNTFDATNLNADVARIARLDATDIQVCTFSASNAAVEVGIATNLYTEECRIGGVEAAKNFEPVAWTPELRSLSDDNTAQNFYSYSERWGTAQKVGNLVFLQFGIHISPSSNIPPYNGVPLILAGLPYVPSARVNSVLNSDVNLQGPGPLGGIYMDYNFSRYTNGPVPSFFLCGRIHGGDGLVHVRASDGQTIVQGDTVLLGTIIYYVD